MNRDTGPLTDQAAGVAGILNRIERLGNSLPHPATLFAALALGVVLLSGLGGFLGWSAVHPITGAEVKAISLLDGPGLRRMLEGTVSNFTSFAPLGTVLVAMLGLGLAERSGLLGALLARMVAAARPQFLSFFVVFAGVLSSLAADAGYVVLIPLAGWLFHAAGRHPFAGIAAAFAGVSAGYSANLMIGSLDAILAGLSTEAARLLDPTYEVTAAGNWWFIIASTVLIALAGTWVTERITAPRLGAYAGEGDGSHDPEIAVSAAGLRAAGWVSLVGLGLLLWALVPADGVLRNPDTGGILGSPAISAIVVLIALFAAAAGIAYGRAAGTLTSSTAVMEALEATMATMAGYLVLMFFAAQFVAWFGWTQLGVITAIHGAAVLQTLDLGTLPLLLTFILIAALINLVIGSASAKWGIMAPVFVPMLYLLGISPEASQMAYRIGDSVSNVLTPLMPYFALVVAFMQRYDRRAGVGTLMATMLPYSLALLLCWSALLGVWIAFDWPLGPGATISLP
jgi:aminobenzoyl-glutamate transport protein